MVITDTTKKKINKKMTQKTHNDFSRSWDNKRESYDLIGKKKVIPQI